MLCMFLQRQASLPEFVDCISGRQRESAIAEIARLELLQGWQRRWRL